METSTAKPPNDDVSPPPPLEEVEEILGYSFEDRTWLEEALTHPSYQYRYGDEETEKSDGGDGGGLSSYERLEYVGDSVLNLIFTKEQFFRYPELMPGDLTRLRAANVDTEKLARVALKHGLFRYLRHKKLLLGDQIEEFSREIMEYPVHSNGLVNPPKTLADLVESLIGAVFIDSGCSVDTVWKVFKRLLEPIVEKETLKVHPVTELYEICQKRKLKLEFKGLWKEGIDVYVNDQFAGRGSYESKKEVAQNRAAKDALDNFGKIVVILSHEDEIEEFSREMKEYPVHSNGLVNPPKTLADLVESLIGAVFIDNDCSVNTVWKVFKRLLEPIVEKETLKVHPVTEIYEICQKRKLKLEFKGLWKEGIDVYVNDQFAGRGSYKSKKEVAQNRAAKDVLDNFGKLSCRTRMR